MNTYLILVILIIGIIIVLITKKQLLSRKEEKQGWKVFRKGRDEIFYMQKISDKWQGIEIAGEILIGKIGFVIYLKTEEEWLEYPNWARNRAEIIERIKIEFPLSHTEYENN